MITYERVTYRPEGATRSRRVFLRNPREVTMAGGVVLTGTEVDNQGDIGETTERIHIIAKELIIERKPATMDLKYAMLVV